MRRKGFEYYEEKRPKWWDPRIPFVKPNKLKRDELKAVLKNAPMEELAVETLCENNPTTPEEKGPVDTLKVAELRQIIFKALKRRKGDRYER